MRPLVPKGLLVVISAPSGCGKTTVIQHLLQQNKAMVRAVTATTRKQRKGEVQGRDYFFITEKEFQEKRRKHDFLEWAEVYGFHYGTLKRATLDELGKGKNVILTIDVQGARQVRKKVEGVFIFIMPPSMEVLEKRLRLRKSDSARQIEKRLMQAREEIACAKEYDYIVTNHDVDESVAAIESIIAKKKENEKRR